MVPLSSSLRLNGSKLWPRTDIRAPSKVVDDETLHTRSFSSIDHGCLVMNTTRTHHTDDGILTSQYDLEVLKRIVSSPDRDGLRMSSRAVSPCDDGHIKTGADQSSRDGSAKVARSLSGSVVVSKLHILSSAELVPTYAKNGDLVDWSCHVVNSVFEGFKYS